MLLTVVVPTHNPDAERLRRTLEGLRAQSLPAAQWELLVVDNASTNDVVQQADLSWHPNARIEREERLGLTSARRCGFINASAPVVVMVDDDNVLARDYLEQSLRIMEADATLGAIGGKSLPRYESPPAEWVKRFEKMLALRDLGSEPLVERWRNGARFYPASAPIGAGMVLRREVASAYLELLNARDDNASGGADLVSDRKGGSLASGGDNEIVLVALAAGYAVGYFPELSLEHLIPEGRCQRDYLARLLYASHRSWIAVQALHGIEARRPVPRAVAPFLKARHWCRVRAWKGPAQYIWWRSYCGEVDGRVELRR